MQIIITSLTDDEINAAANFLIGPRTDDRDKELEAFSKIVEFRATFAYALRAVSAVLRKRAFLIDSNATVYGRPKRLPSLLMKLLRMPTLKATNMQDIGGCRAVLEDVAAVKLLAEEFRAMKLEGIKENNYIERPKDDGYRSIHFVVNFSPRNPIYENVPSRKIEIQLRSRLQHQ
jgi:ppGpp synthetase/RelA/SpoT-type nucleotidyltranferase